MAYTDQTIVCADCGAEFSFSASEQEFYAEKGLTSAPKRCKPCRAAAKSARGGDGGHFGGSRPARTGEREMHDVTCDQCGAKTQVPFKPNGLKPVYCRDCFRR
ncbi:MAG TPA: zinc-ribbon domain containing protein [Oscillatoriaceae cyanobacterium]